MTLHEEAGKGVLREALRNNDWYKEKIKKLDEEQVSNFAATILLQRSTIFVAGRGRSGLVAKCFAMRLAQLGYKARYLGEETVPPIRKGNLFIIVSGSGTNLVNEAKVAQEELGAKILVITSHANSPLAKIADFFLILPGREEEDPEMTYDERMIKGLAVLPLGTGFEGLTLAIFDALTGYEGAEKHLSEKDMQAKHAKPLIS
ncbi:MAG: SIS domain-containing protein [Parcubacteria group bacterium]|nr:MAG: SIS domain-containing protein [Parcubacteria group bacterium]